MNLALGKLIMQAVSWVMLAMGGLCALLLALVLLSVATGEEVEPFLLPVLGTLTVLLLGLAWLFRRTARRAAATEEAAATTQRDDV